MSTENELFQNAAAAAKSLPEKPDNNTLLELYALYKQGSGGDVSGDKPGFFDFVAAAWYSFKVITGSTRWPNATRKN
ncbi:MAG: acyl-CoA-binding protein [Xanthomonadales bacterium]